MGSIHHCSHFSFRSIPCISFTHNNYFHISIRISLYYHFFGLLFPIPFLLSLRCLCFFCRYSLPTISIYSLIFLPTNAITDLHFINNILYRQIFIILAFLLVHRVSSISEIIETNAKLFLLCGIKYHWLLISWNSIKKIPT